MHASPLFSFCKVAIMCPQSRVTLTHRLSPTIVFLPNRIGCAEACSHAACFLTSTGTSTHSHPVHAAFDSKGGIVSTLFYHLASWVQALDWNDWKRPFVVQEVHLYRVPSRATRKALLSWRTSFKGFTILGDNAKERQWSM